MLLLPFARKIVRGRLERRYKRFFADCVLESSAGRDDIVVAHTSNTGSMTGLLQRGNPVLLADQEGTTRKLAYSLEAICADGAWVGCNTALPNAFVEEAIRRGLVPELAGYAAIRREVKYGQGGRSRIDLLLTDDGATPPRTCFVEVKSVTLKHGTRAAFPDSVTERGLKHVAELVRERKRGAGAAFVFLCQRTDCDAFAPAWSVDPAYSKALAAAAKQGVLVLAIESVVDERGLSWSRRLPVDLAPPAAARRPEQVSA